MKQIAFTVFHNPAPWQVFTRYSEAPGKARLKLYQVYIQGEAKRAMKEQPPHPGPVQLDMTFCLEIPPRCPKRPDARQRWVSEHILMKPDRTNLQKGAEDALASICYERDQQVIAGYTTKEFREQGCTMFIVKFL